MLHKYTTKIYLGKTRRKLFPTYLIFLISSFFDKVKIDIPNLASITIKVEKTNKLPVPYELKIIERLVGRKKKIILVSPIHGWRERRHT